MPVEAPYRVPLRYRLLRAGMKPAFSLLFRLLARVRVHGREHVPYGQPYMVAINHISLFDPPFVLAFWPEMLEAMGASDLWKRPGQGLLVRLYHGIPVHRGQYDRQVLDQAQAVLASGRPLLIAPEGGRSHSIAMRQARPGLAFILENTGVPVVPVGLIGTTDDFWQQARRGLRPQLEMRIGRPLQLPPISGAGESRRRARQQNADLVMAHIAGLLPPEYHGYYAGQAVVPD